MWYVQAQIPEACNGSIPQVRPFHFSLPVVSANFHMMSMANRNSNTEEKWMAQVGMERALTGSECKTGGERIVGIHISNKFG